MEREEFSQPILDTLGRLLTDSVQALTLDDVAFSGLLLNCFAECLQKTTKTEDGSFLNLLQKMKSREQLLGR